MEVLFHLTIRMDLQPGHPALQEGNFEAKRRLKDNIKRQISGLYPDEMGTIIERGWWNHDMPASTGVTATDTLEIEGKHYA